MTLTDLLSQLDESQVEALASKAGTKPIYLQRVARGYRKASPILCRQLVAADDRLTLPELRPDIYGLMPSQEQAA